MTLLSTVARCDKESRIDIEPKWATPATAYLEGEIIQSEELQRHLTSCQIQLIAIDSSTGTALFVSIG